MGDAIELLESDIRLRTIETRLPFEFGIATMRKLPHCFVTCDLAVDGTEVRGIAADHFPPKWFTKDPDQSLATEVEALLAVVQHACRVAEGVTGATPFDCWQEVYDAQAAWGADTDHPPLLWGFGVTFVERAMIDAFCRATDRTFSEAVAAGALGTRPGDIYPAVEGASPAEHVPEEPLDRVRVRHTVGHDDPLTDRPPEAPDDGLPVTLVENIDAYGLDRFKLKIGGDVETDHARLREVLGVLESACDSYAYTLDANEQYRSVGDLRELMDRLEADEEIPDLAETLLFVEQPFPRGMALSVGVGDALRSWTDAPAIIIDESDGELDSFGRALERGYAGTSYKNCKGVFKGLANACLAGHRRAAGERAIISGEDLTTIGPVSVQQDLAAMATLGISHVERNGHHYFRGLSMFEDDVQRAVLDAHGDLFRAHEDGFITLDVTDGGLELSSVIGAPFGVAARVDPSRYASPAEWTFEPPSG